MASSRFSYVVKKRTKSALVAVGKRVPALLDGMRWGIRTVRSSVQWVRNLSTPVDPAVTVFQCYNGRAYSCSPRAIYQEMLASPDAGERQLVWAFKGPIVQELANRGGYDVRGLDDFHTEARFDGDLDQVFGAQALEELKHAVIVPFGSREYYRVHARAALWVTNSIIPTHLKPRHGQVYLQTWHGTPLKRLGCDIPTDKTNAMFSVSSIHRRYREEGRRMTYLVSPSAYATRTLGSAFDLSALGKADAIVEEGYPRNDVLAKHDEAYVSGIRERLGIPADKKVILYAPTWRDDKHKAGVGYVYDVAVDFERLRDALARDYVVLFRAHYLVANEFDFSRFEGFVYDVSSVGDINDLYLVADLLVTDYSSVFFDYSVLARPVIFYMYDLETYAEDIRGFYLELDELPGPVVRTDVELVGAVRALEADDSAAIDRAQAFRAVYAPLDDGHAAQRTLARIAADREAGRV